MKRHEALLWVVIFLFMLAWGLIIASRAEAADSLEQMQNKADWHIEQAQKAVIEVTPSLTTDQEFLLYNVIIEMGKARDLRVKMAYRAGIKNTCEELLRQGVMNRADLLMFIKNSIDYQEGSKADESSD